MPDAILIINAGLSSIKFSLFEIGGSRQLTLASVGEAEGIGTAPHFVARDRAGTVLAEQRWPDPNPPFQSILETIISWAETHLGADTLFAVGHRIVHGGPHHERPERVTSALLALLDQLTPLAPLHLPHNIAPIRAIAAARPDLPQVVCFDTAFHHGMPEVATRYALPREYEADGVRRYGFHGLSYEYIAGRCAMPRPNSPPAGSSPRISATAPAFAPCSPDAASIRPWVSPRWMACHGHPLRGTRSGRDPLAGGRARPHHAAGRGLALSPLGLLGVSGGISSDMRKLLASTDPHAREAIELFTYRMAREIGALTQFARRAGRHRVYRRDRRAFAGGPRTGLRAAWLVGRRARSGGERPCRRGHQRAGKPRFGPGHPNRRGSDDRAAHAGHGASASALTAFVAPLEAKVGQPSPRGSLDARLPTGPPSDSVSQSAKGSEPP